MSNPKLPAREPCVAILCGEGFFEKKERDRAASAEHRQHGEGCAPASMRNDERANDRRQHRGDHGHRLHNGEDGVARAAVEAILDHRCGDRDHTASAKGLQHARDDEQPDARGERAGCAEDRVNERARDEQSAAAVFVRKRAKDQRADGHEEKESDKREIDGGFCRVKSSSHVRHRRQIHIQRQRHDHVHKCDENNDEAFVH